MLNRTYSGFSPPLFLPIAKRKCCKLKVKNICVFKYLNKDDQLRNLKLLMI